MSSRFIATRLPLKGSSGSFRESPGSRKPVSRCRQVAGTPHPRAERGGHQRKPTETNFSSDSCDLSAKTACTLSFLESSFSVSIPVGVTPYSSASERRFSPETTVICLSCTPSSLAGLRTGKEQFRLGVVTPFATDNLSTWPPMGG